MQTPPVYGVYPPPYLYYYPYPVPPGQCVPPGINPYYPPYSSSTAPDSTGLVLTSAGTSVTQGNSRSDKKTSICFCCGAKGHIATTCHVRTNGVICATCGRAGHLVIACKNR